MHRLSVSEVEVFREKSNQLFNLPMMEPNAVFLTKVRYLNRLMCKVEYGRSAYYLQLYSLLLITTINN